MNFSLSVQQKKPEFKEFFEFLEYARGVEGSLDSLQQIYTKNLDMIKKNLKFENKIHNFEEISMIFKEIFLSRIYEQKKELFKSFFMKMRILFIWVVSLYGTINKKPSDNMEQKDWKNISKLFPKSDPLKLKYKWFTFLSTNNCSKIWTIDQTQTLKKIMKYLYPELYETSSHHLKLKISWSRVSFEMSKEIQKIPLFKSDKQCKEHWFNHLNPFLNKKTWSLEDDIELMKTASLYPLKWSLISRNFSGRTQHQIKNRFFCLLCEELHYKRDKVRNLIEKNLIKESIKQTLDNLNIKKLINFDEIYKSEKKSEIFNQTTASTSEGMNSGENMENTNKNLINENSLEVYANNEGFFQNNEYCFLDSFLNCD